MSVKIELTVNESVLAKAQVFFEKYTNDSWRMVEVTDREEFVKVLLNNMLNNIGYHIESELFAEGSNGLEDIFDDVDMLKDCVKITELPD